MNDLIQHNHANAEGLEAFLALNPNAGQGWRRALDIMQKIHSWQDVETYLLRGSGLAANTYAAYLSAVRGLYQHTGGLSPFQVTAGHVESYADALAARGVRPNGRANQMYGLQRFFRSVAELAPGWVSPFDVMAPALRRKLFKNTRPETKRSLSGAEVRALLLWLRERDRGSYGLVALLVSTGLRASEAAALIWADVEHDPEDGTWYVNGIGKGAKPFHQEVGIPDALDALAHGHREGPVLRRRDGSGMDRKAAHYVVGKIGKAAEAAGVVKASRRIQWSPHLFRRSFATTPYKAGVRVKALAELTRHSNVDVLARHYLDDREKSGPVFARIMGGVA